VKRFKAVVIGGTGYGGAELIRRLLIHPDVELIRVVAIDHVGEPLGAVHPPLTGRSAQGIVTAIGTELTRFQIAEPTLEDAYLLLLERTGP